MRAKHAFRGSRKETWIYLRREWHSAGADTGGVRDPQAGSIAFVGTCSALFHPSVAAGRVPTVHTLFFRHLHAAHGALVAELG